jgi:hypothetical protein
MKSDTISIIVTGDIVLDRHVYGGERATLGDSSTHGTHLVEEAGGAALTYRLTQAVLAADVKERILQWEQKLKTREAARKDSKEAGAAPPKPEGPVCRLGRKLPEETGARWPERLIGYAWWAPYPKPDSKDKVWRVSKAFGYGPPDDQEVAAGLAQEAPPFFQAADNLPPVPQILVLDDAGERFRQKAQSALWCLPTKIAPAAELPAWIVLKLAGPIGRGDLWDTLMIYQPQKRLVILASARLFRLDDVRLSRGLSWERTVEHLRHELAHNPAIRPLSQARHLIVNFEGDGAVWIDYSDPAQPNARLIFDAAHAEGEWASRSQGQVFGYLTCLTAATVLTLVSPSGNNKEYDFQPAIERGLSAMRNLREEGHDIAISDKDDFKRGHGFPTERLAKEILHPTHRFARAIVPWSQPRKGAQTSVPWSILASLQNPFTPKRPLYGFARQLAIRGPVVLEHVPHLRMRQLITAGRDEMETLRSLRRILEAYRDTDSGKRPLSIGVFGAPGSGKSFGVEQMTLGVFGDPAQKSYGGWKEFNLSQFDQPEDLIGAFHQVRDIVLQGFVPVVFWDEFDSREYKWLQYLLAPMQDGRFQQGQITHTLGKCVFVFAGGTAEAFEEFGPKENSDKDAERQFKLAKGPDFKSRLDGYLNVLGPNQRLLPEEGSEERKKDPNDIFFPVRRALIIRNALGCERNDERLEIDAGVLTALLEVPDYEHGARSLRKILEPLSAARKVSRAPLRRSLLPAPNQLSPHVDSNEFHEICARDLSFKTDEIVRKLAPAIHETWRTIAHQQKWAFRYDVPFDELPLDIKRSNEAAARRIPEIIALVGLQVVPEAAKDETTKIRRQLERHLEVLAEEEHNGWMAHLKSEGWQYAEARDDDNRRHNCLRPFNELREIDKEKDRDTIRHYPDFAMEADFKIVFI